MEKSFRDILKEELAKHEPSLGRIPSYETFQQTVFTESLAFTRPIRFKIPGAQLYKVEPRLHLPPEMPLAQPEVTVTPPPPPVERSPRTWTSTQELALYQLKRLGAELDINATDEEIKKAHRKLARLFHPDMNSHLSEFERRHKTEQFHALQEAYALLIEDQQAA